MPSNGLLLRVLLGLVALASPLLAQAQDERQSLSEAKSLLDARDREVMHPADDPLVVVGREQGDNDLRSKTPALVRSDRVAALVDPEEAHARAIALYESGASFSEPPKSSRTPSGAESTRSARRRTPRKAASIPAPTSPSPWWSSALPSLGIGLVILLLVLRRIRKSQNASG